MLVFNPAQSPVAVWVAVATPTFGVVFKQLRAAFQVSCSNKALSRACITFPQLFKRLLEPETITSLASALVHSPQHPECWMSTGRSIALSFNNRMIAQSKSLNLHWMPHCLYNSETTLPSASISWRYRSVLLAEVRTCCFDCLFLQRVSRCPERARTVCQGALPGFGTTMLPLAKASTTWVRARPRRNLQTGRTNHT